MKRNQEDEKDPTGTLGGVHNLRGANFELHALLFYVLLRRYDHPQLRVRMQSGGDAEIVTGKAGDPSIEYVECKKVETGDGKKQCGSIRGDVWRPGRVPPSVLKGWLDGKHGVLSRLASNVDAFCTLLVFGAPTVATKAFVPDPLKGVRIPSMIGADPFAEFPFDHHHTGFDRTTIPWIRDQADACSRVRMLPFGEPPAQLELACRGLLEHRPYDVSRQRSADIVRELLRLFAVRREFVDAGERWIEPAEIESILAVGRARSGRWAELAAADRPYIEEGLVSEILARCEATGLAVLTGPPGSGKTRVCQELARRIAAGEAAPGRATRYLRITPNIDLSDEIRFVEANLEEPFLFLVDDEHLAADEVIRLVYTFADRFVFSRPRAWLLVTSIKTYSQTQYRPLSTGRRGSVLNLADSVQIREGRSRVLNVLRGLAGTGGLRSSATPDLLAEVSGENLSVAMAIDEAARSFGDDIPSGRLKKRPQFVSYLEEWIASSLPGKAADDRMAIRSALTLTSFGIPIPIVHSPAVGALLNAGFLSAGAESDYGPVAESANANLASVLAATLDIEEQFAAIHMHAKHYPRLLPRLVACLGSPRKQMIGQMPTGPALLRRLATAYDLAALLRDRIEPFRAAEVAMILSSVGRVERSLGTRLLQSVLAPGGDPDPRYLVDLMSFHTTTPDDIATLLFTCWLLDRSTTQKVGGRLAERRSQTLEALFARNEYRLDAIGRCLRAICLVDREAKDGLLRRWQTTGLPKRLVKIPAEPGSIPVLVRYCDQIRTVDRAAALEALELALPPGRLEDALEDWKDPPLVFQFLYTLRKLHRLLANRTAGLLLASSEHRLRETLEAESELVGLRNTFYHIASFNRPFARRMSRRIQPHIRKVVASETSHHRLGNAFEGIEAALGEREARSWIEHVDWDQILASLSAETRSVNLVGSFLWSLQRIAPELAARLTESLDWRDYLPRIHSWILPNLAFLLRGFVAASPMASRGGLIGAIESHAGFRDLVDRGWEEAQSLNQSVLALDLLLQAGLEPDTIRQLLADAGGGAADARIEVMFERSESCLDIAQGVYVLRKLDPALAEKVMSRYLERVRSAREHGARQGEYLPEGARDPVAVGRILVAAAASDLKGAQYLAKGIDLDRLRDMSVGYEDLGRLREVISGLAVSSHTAVVDFLDGVQGAAQIEWQVRGTPNFLSTVQYAHTVTLASKNRGIDFIRYVNREMREHVVAELTATASLSVLAGWLRSSLIAGEVDDDLVTSICSIMTDAIEYEGRLISLLEAAEACASANRLEEALHFAARSVEFGWQLRNMSSAVEWVSVLERTHRLGGVLGQTGYVDKLLAATEPWHFRTLVLTETNAAAAGLASRVATSLGLPHPGGDKDVAKLAVRAARQDPDLVRRTVGLLLGGAPGDALATLHTLGDVVLWEYGLLRLAAHASGDETFRREMPRSVSVLSPEANELASIIDGPSVYLGLSMLGASDRHVVPDELAAECALRAEDEITGALRHMLQGRIDPALWQERPYAYLKLISEVTAGERPGWASEIDRSVAVRAFG